MDTSVYGGFFEPEFELWTKILFKNVGQGEYRILFSELTNIELANAPLPVKRLVSQIPEEKLDFLPLTDEAVQLAERYIAAGVVGKTSRADCIHIALATINHTDVLISWNFKHIVNLPGIRGYHAINLTMNYPVLENRSSGEIVEHED